MTFNGHLPVEASLPLPEMNLAKIRFHRRCEPKCFSERSNGLMCAPKRRDVDRIDRLGTKPSGDSFGLRVPVIGKRWISLPIDKVEQLPIHERGRLSVADQQNLGCSRGRRERPLAKIGGVSRRHRLTLPTMTCLRDADKAFPRARIEQGRT